MICSLTDDFPDPVLPTIPIFSRALCEGSHEHLIVLTTLWAHDFDVKILEY